MEKIRKRLTGLFGTYFDDASIPRHYLFHYSFCETVSVERKEHFTNVGENIPCKGFEISSGSR